MNIGPNEISQPLLEEPVHELNNSFFGSINGSFDQKNNNQPVTKVYFKRWFILILFSLLTFSQCLIWLTWSSVANSALAVYGWPESMIPLLLDWGNIPYIFLSVPICWYLNECGLRKATILTTLTMTIGTGLRCLTFDSSKATPLIHMGQFMNGISSIIFNGAPSQISAKWFPVHERTTATTILIISGPLAISASYFIGPGIVHYVPNSTAADLAHQKIEIIWLLLLEFILCYVLFLLVLFFFSDGPKTPPTTSAIQERLNFKEAFKSLKGNLNFWLAAFGQAISIGVAVNWLGLLEPSLQPFGILQDEAGHLGTYGTLAGCFISLIIARIIDKLGGYIKCCLVIILIIAVLNFSFFGLMSYGIVPHNTSLLYIVVILTAVVTYCGQPLYMEIASEVAYPVSEGVVGVILQTLTNSIGTVFLLLFLIPNIGTSWFNWCLIVMSIIGLILVLLLKENYQRSNLDKPKIEGVETDNDDSLMI